MYCTSVRSYERKEKNNGEKGDLTMRIITRAVAAVLSAAIAVPTFVGGSTRFESEAATSVVISPFSVFDINGGKFEGWGTSLCWWANRVGYSDSLAQQAADRFYGDDGLRLNIARFNIGGGDDPSHDHITRTDSNMPGYTRYSNGNITYDWSADYNQRNVLQRCIKAAGDDMIVEMFSNSPPYYMTKSGCSSGGTDPGKNNLKDDQYEEFADYLAEVSYHYKNEWGVDIQSITPTNEPYTNFWGAGSVKQEGCHFDIGSSESKVILELQRAMSQRGMSDVIISASDETSIDTQISAFNALSADAKKAVGRIDTHTYGGSKRSELRQLAINSGKNLWMSEVDGGSTAGTNAGEMGAALWLADRINLDVNELNCSAWILWQVIDKHICAAGYNGKKDSGMVDLSGGYWGTAVADHDKDTIILTKKYYAFGQYTRYIRPGMTMLKAANAAVVGFDQEKGELAIVAVNDKPNAVDVTYDLSQFSELGSSAETIRTSNSESWKNIGASPVNSGRLSVTLAPSSVTTFVIEGVKGGAELTDKIDVDLSKVTGSDPWKSDMDHDCTKAFDGSNSTYFDGLGHGWVEVDLGDTYELSAIGYCPRSGFEYRCPKGTFSISADGENWSELYTIEFTPSYGMNYVTRFRGEAVGRYFRYQLPEGTPDGSINRDSTYCCNIAEIALYGTKKEAPEETLGDVDGDGSLRINDLVLLEKFLHGNGRLSRWQNGDFDNDGRIDSFDLILMRKHMIAMS